MASYFFDILWRSPAIHLKNVWEIFECDHSLLCSLVDSIRYILQRGGQDALYQDCHGVISTVLNWSTRTDSLSSLCAFHLRDIDWWTLSLIHCCIEGCSVFLELGSGLVYSSAKNSDEILLVDAIFVLETDMAIQESIKFLVRNFILEFECFSAPIFEINECARWFTSCKDSKYLICILLNCTQLLSYSHQDIILISCLIVLCPAKILLLVSLLIFLRINDRNFNKELTTSLILFISDFKLTINILSLSNFL